MRAGKKWQKARSIAGFTMAEVLLTVAILSILAAVAFVGVTAMQKSLRQKGLDSKAETIYVAVQNQLTKLRTSGMSIKYQPTGNASEYPGATGTDVVKLPGDPSDWDYAVTITASGGYEVSEPNLYYIKKDADGITFSDPQVAYYLMSEDTVEDSLRGHYWVVEYDPKTADVYAVFYWEDNVQGPGSVEASGYDFGKFNKLRKSSERRASKNYVGYYSGNVTGDSSSLSGKNEITFTNGEKLFGVFQYAFSEIPDKNVVFTIILRDQHGHTRNLTYKKMPDPNEGQLTMKGKRFFCTVMFDDLQSSSTRFYNVYGKGNTSLNESTPGNQPLVAGDNITASLIVDMPDDNTFAAKAFEGGTFNSLYADDSTLSTDENPEEVTSAHIACIRHLQNLDMGYMPTEGTGYAGADKVTAALQTSDLSFKKDESNSSNWYAVYPGAKENEEKRYLDQTGEDIAFVPIRNICLKTYEAAQDGEGGTKIYHTITSLPVKVKEDNGSAGLFAVLANEDDTTLSNVRLRGPQVFATGTGSSAGALFGNAAQKLTIRDCQVYLSEANGDLEATINGVKASSTTPWISGTYSGGLIGSVTDGAVTIENSFASLVVGSVDTNGMAKAATSAGGLVGQMTGGTLTVTKSYADSYILAEKVGGLVGSASTVADKINITSSYAAGFLTTAANENGEGAGLVDGLATIGSSYTFVSKAGVGDRKYYSTAYLESDVSNTYYYAGGSVDTPGAGGTTLNIDGDGKSAGFMSMKAADLLAKLGSEFSLSSEDGTTPYNLMQGMALDIYPYPHISGMRHYGDWQTSFVQGALVYYELYTSASSSVRFYGGNISTLYDNLEVGAVKGDGYGVVYQRNYAHKPEKVYITTGFAPGEVEEINIASPSVVYSYTDPDGTIYDVYPMKTATVNPVVTAEQNFYMPVKVVYDSNPTAELYYFSPYFARSVGYLQETGKDAGIGSPEMLAAMPKLADDAMVYVRSARHLYNMSLYYKYYREATKGRTFRQTWELSYTDYDWNNFYKAGDAISQQNPIGVGTIGAGEYASFIANYDGGCYKIDNVSFVLQNEANGSSSTYYAGLFGRNEGTIKDVVLWADYDEKGSKQYYIGTTANIGMNQTMYMGALAGFNGTAGKISNCAVAGYYLANQNGTVRGYSNGYIYAGGLVGGNANGGSISSCSADTPYIRVSTTYATAYVAGFVGENFGNVRGSYALGHIEVVSPKGGSIAICGFAGRNSGDISSCYAAVNLQTSGDMTTAYAFSPDTGSVSGCEYLYGGTYSYADHLYAFNVQGGAGTFSKFDEMKSKSVRYSYNYPSISAGSEGYPYRGAVRDANGNLVHYGDWQKYADLGTLGVFYWEYEDGGNSGYHVSFIGVTNKKASDSSSNNYSFEVDSTLCSAHDDGGNITKFGYGYYKKTNDKDAEISLKINDKTAPWDQLKTNSDAASALAKEFKDFTFTPFNTTAANSPKLDGTELYLDKDAGAYDTWEISKYIKKNGLTTEEINLKVDVAPFFANAMRIESVNGLAISGKIEKKMSDGRTRDFNKALGTDAANGYDIRNISQLEYINWNAANKNATTLVPSDESVYKKYPYLAYATVTDVGKQGDEGHPAGNDTKRYFVQTHDFTSDTSFNYTPIAAAGTTSNSGYNSTLYAWFGGSFDGQSYMIRNISISSKAYAIGLFGVTVSADIKNIIMYSDRDSEIARAAGAPRGAYVLGGLIGVAYRYNKNKTEDNAITNCSIAGYQIVDHSNSHTTSGGTNVGGLVGVADVDINGCSAVTDIDIASTRPGNIDYFDTIRVGGLCAALPGKVKNCYTGGSIKVSGGVLNSQNTRSLEYKGKNYTVIKLNSSSSIYIAGIAASGFSMNYQNFTGVSKTREGIPYVENSYTYMKFPPIVGSIRQITMITGLADRCRQAKPDGQPAGLNVTIKNCYYWKGSAEIDVSGAEKRMIDDDGVRTDNVWVRGETVPEDASPVYYWDSLYNILNGPNKAENFQNMLNGDVAYMFEMRGIDNAKAATVPERLVGARTPTERTYEQLSDQTTDNMATKLGSVWGWVTTKQGSAAIDGKFSFPGNKRELIGLNYPFPTIIWQNDLVYGGKDNVHYGSWPLNGAYWEAAREEMDIFRDRKPSETEALKTIKLRSVKNAALTADILNNGLQVKGIFEVKSVTKTANSDGKTYDYDVVFKAIKAGSDELTFTDTDSVTTKLTMEVTAFLNVATLPGEIKQSVGKETELALYATSMAAADNDYSTATGVTWEVTSRNNDIVTITAKEGAANVYKIKGVASGRTQLVVKATATYGSETFVSTQYVSLLNYGVLGLSNNGLEGTYDGTSNQSFYNEVNRSEANADGAAATPATAPVLTDEGKADLYLYESADDQQIGRAQILSKKVVGHDDYTIDISDTVIMDEHYSYRRVTVRPPAGDPGGEVTVSLKLKDMDTEAEYTLSGKLFASHVVTYDINGGDAAQLAAGFSRIKAGAKALGTVADTAPERPGYTFEGWKDSNDTTYQVTNSIAEITKDDTLTAQWKAKTYYIKYHSNRPKTFYPSPELHPEYVSPEVHPKPPEERLWTYGTELTLAGSGDLSAPPPGYGYTMIGWNTKTDYSGTSFAFGSKVTSLPLDTVKTEDEKEVIYLYAQWADTSKVKLTFKDNFLGATDEKRSRKVDLMGVTSAPYPVEAAVLPDRVKDAEQQTIHGIKGYYWTDTSGSPEVTYHLLGWSLNADATEPDTGCAIGDDGTLPELTVTGPSTYYAVWEKVTYTVILMSGGSEYARLEGLSGTELELTTAVNAGSVAKPTKTDYVLTGFYNKALEETDFGTKQVADNWGIVNNDGKGTVADYAQNFEWTIYARFRKNTTVSAYFPIESQIPNYDDGTGKVISMILFEYEGSTYSVFSSGGVIKDAMPMQTVDSYCASNVDGTNPVAIGTKYTTKEGKNYWWRYTAGTNRLQRNSPSNPIIIAVPSAGDPYSYQIIDRNTTPQIAAFDNAGQRYYYVSPAGEYLTFQAPKEEGGDNTTFYVSCTGSRGTFKDTVNNVTNNVDFVGQSGEALNKIKVKYYQKRTVYSFAD